MNNPANTENSNLPTRGRGRGGRGRGVGGRGGTPAVQRAVVANATHGKIGPTRLLEHSWIDDSSLKGKSFVVWVGGGLTGPRQVTIHRPIGETKLAQTQWVATPSAEVPLLLERRKSEALSAYERQKAVAIKQEVLQARMGRRLNHAQPPQEVWSFDGSAECAPTIRQAMATAKAAGRPESDWLSFSSDQVKTAEAVFKAALRDPRYAAAFMTGHPKPAHETRGGPVGDRPQMPVVYLNGLSLSAAKDKVLAVIFGGLGLDQALITVFPPLGEDQEESEPEA